MSSESSELTFHGAYFSHGWEAGRFEFASYASYASYASVPKTRNKTRKTSKAMVE